MMPDPQALPLHDIHLPDAVSWWPPAPGWWLLPGLLLLVALSVFYLSRRRRRYAVRRAARAELLRLHAEHQHQPDAKKLLRELSVLLRRACLSCYARHDSAGLSGQDWLRFLDRGVADEAFSKGVGKLLLTRPYDQQPVTDQQLAQLLALCRAWIEALPAVSGEDGTA